MWWDIMYGRIIAAYWGPAPCERTLSSKVMIHNYCAKYGYKVLSFRLHVNYTETLTKKKYTSYSQDLQNIMTMLKKCDKDESSGIAFVITY